MNKLLVKFDVLIWNPLKKWVRGLGNRNNDDDPFGDNPYIIL